MADLPKEQAVRPVPTNQLSRRDFARRAAMAATTAVVARAVLAQEASSPPPSASTDKPATEGLSSELQREGELKYQWIVQRYGDRLSAAEKQDVHRLVMEGQKPLAAFRAFPLANGDMPALVLKFTDAENGGSGEPS